MTAPRSTSSRSTRSRCLPSLRITPEASGAQRARHIDAPQEVVGPSPDARAVVVDAPLAVPNHGPGKLCPPLLLGALPAFLAKMQADALTPMRPPVERRPGMLEGMPASAGRLRAVARVILDLADAD